MTPPKKIGGVKKYYNFVIQRKNNNKTYQL